MSYRLAFIGPAQTGKTTCAQYCADKYGGRVVSFAEKLKKIAMHTFGWDGKKDEKGRRFLQDLGGVVRNYNIDFWANYALRQLTPRGSYYVDDCRFENEAQKLVDNGFTIVRIVPFEFDLSEPWRLDVSENSLDDYCTSYIILSRKGDIEGLKISVDQLIERLYGNPEEVLASNSGSSTSDSSSSGSESGETDSAASNYQPYSA